MPPFSNKKKKEQLQLKRQLKRERADDPNSFYKSIMSRSLHKKGGATGSNSNNHQRHNQIKATEKGRERFADLQFFKDDDDEIRKRKEGAQKPLVRLEPCDLEIDADSPAAGLDMPKRPRWDKSMSKFELNQHEQIYFKRFVDNLLMEAESNDRKLSYFDLNLETWRQLWRVIEMSEIVTIIVDVRHPLFHFPPSLYNYIVKDLDKMVLIVLNKIDLVPAPLVLAWMDYLKRQYPEIHIIPFASYAGMKTKKNGKRVGKLHMATDAALRFMLEVRKMVGHEVDLSSWKEKIDDELKSHSRNDRPTQAWGRGGGTRVFNAKVEDDTDEDSDPDSPKSAVKGDEHSESDVGDSGSVERSSSETDDSGDSEHENNERPHEAQQKKSQESKMDKYPKSHGRNDNQGYSESDSEDSDECTTAKKALKRAEIISQQNDTSFYHEEKFKNGMLTIGCVGHPNVGKSSFMNALIGKKVVSVSRTPGHTKHFQTIFLTPNVRLCDCPGLVFPSYYPKQLQVLMGCYPISQLREPTSSVQYLAERIDIPKILKLAPPEEFLHPVLVKQRKDEAQKCDQQSSEFQWSAFSICESWAYVRGFLTARSGRPDVYRAANHLLRMALDGRTLCLSFYPPDYIKQKSHWEQHDQIELIRSIQGVHNILDDDDGWDVEKVANSVVG